MKQRFHGERYGEIWRDLMLFCQNLQRDVCASNTCIYVYIYWLVVSTPLKNISQREGLSHILWKIKHVPVTTNQYIIIYIYIYKHIHIYMFEELLNT